MHRAFSNPLPSDLVKLAKIEGLGTLHGETVSGCSTTYGIDIRFLPEGESEPLPGYARFRLEVDAEGQVHWTFVHAWNHAHGHNLVEAEQQIFAEPIFDAMRAHAESLCDRDPIRFGCYLLETLEAEHAHFVNEKNGDQATLLAPLVAEARASLRKMTRRAA